MSRRAIDETPNNIKCLKKNLKRNDCFFGQWVSIWEYYIYLLYICSGANLDSFVAFFRKKIRFWKVINVLVIHLTRWLLYINIYYDCGVQCTVQTLIELILDMYSFVYWKWWMMYIIQTLFDYRYCNWDKG